MSLVLLSVSVAVAADLEQAFAMTSMGAESRETIVTVLIYCAEEMRRNR